MASRPQKFSFFHVYRSAIRKRAGRPRFRDYASLPERLPAAPSPPYLKSILFTRYLHQLCRQVQKSIKNGKTAREANPSKKGDPPSKGNALPQKDARPLPFSCSGKPEKHRNIEAAPIAGTDGKNTRIFPYGYPTAGETALFPSDVLPKGISGRRSSGPENLQIEGNRKHTNRKNSHRGRRKPMFQSSRKKETNRIPISLGKTPPPEELGKGA